LEARYHTKFQNSKLSGASVTLEEMIEGKIQVTGRWGRRRKQLLADFKDTGN
jgi:hypothetical protein